MCLASFSCKILVRVTEQQIHECSLLYVCNQTVCFGGFMVAIASWLLHDLLVLVHHPSSAGGRIFILLAG